MRLQYMGVLGFSARVYEDTVLGLTKLEYKGLLGYSLRVYEVTA